MLNHLRQHAIDALCTARAATLSTHGPADIQANIFPCEAAGLSLYLLVPRTSDHLFNLEHNPEVVVTTEGWQLRGVADLSAPCPDHLGLLSHPDAAWCQVLKIQPTRLQIQQTGVFGYVETIDIDSPPPGDG